MTDNDHRNRKHLSRNGGILEHRLVLDAYMSRVGLSGHGFFKTPDVHFDRETCKGRPFAYHVYGTAIFEVTVDCLRGVYDLDSVKIVHDVGRPINEKVDLGQVDRVPGGACRGDPIGPSRGSRP